MNVLITGGAGYIGSHMVKALKEAGHKPVVLDNLVKGHREAVRDSIFIAGDIADSELLGDIFTDYDIEGVIHLAAHSLVGESMEKPGKYYRNNFCGGVNLLETMIEHEIRYIVFSSTAAVYGEPEEIPIPENHPVRPENIYGESKVFFEQALERYDQIHGLKYSSLRYFNAAGADPEGEIGEAHEPETHLIPIVLQKALGEREELYIFGDDYDTRDGSCIRDYIHVNDLAGAHILALEDLAAGGESDIFNLGNGRGYSVKEVIAVAGKVAGRELEAEVGDRRPGDPARLVASSQKIRDRLGWEPQYPQLETIIETAWNWHRKGGFDADA